MIHVLILVLLTIGLVCDASDVRSGNPAEFLLAGSAMLAIVVLQLLRDRQEPGPA